MKSIILKSVFFSILSAGLFTSCVKDEFGTPTLGDCSETSLVKNREVSQISAGAVVAVATASLKTGAVVSRMMSSW